MQKRNTVSSPACGIVFYAYRTARGPTGCLVGDLILQKNLIERVRYIADAVAKHKI